MNAVERYSGKVTDYLQGRWEYAGEAVQSLIGECALSEDSIVADIGSGTGMVARHFVDRVRTVFAVEPNAEMRSIATKALHAHRSYIGVNALSDATTLPDGSVRLITVGRALHWFPAESTRAEFCRILEPEGWLAIFSVPCTDAALLNSLKEVRVRENGWDPAFDKDERAVVPLRFYFGHEGFRTLSVAGSVNETWEVFLGRICSWAAAPGPDHPRRANFERALRGVFERHGSNNVLHVTNETRITFGRVNGPRLPASSQ